jgi:hypothetical protein
MNCGGEWMFRRNHIPAIAIDLINFHSRKNEAVNHQFSGMQTPSIKKEMTIHRGQTTCNKGTN